MATLGIDGLSSGLDSTSIINSMMAIEGNQQVLLKQKQTTASSTVSALQSLNTKVASLAAAAKTAATPASWGAVTAKSSATSVTATAAAGASLSTLSFTVDAVATSQSSLLTVPADLDPANLSLTITTGGKAFEVKPASADPRDIAAAINTSESGVKATAINVGTADAPSYRLQLTGTQTGAANNFTVSYAATGEADPVAATLSTVRAAGDAKITLFPGTDGAQAVTSSSNSFASILPDVTINVSAVESEAVTVDVNRNDPALTALASSIVSNLNVVLSEIASRTAKNTGKAEDGSELVKGGLLSGDTAVRFLQQDILTAGSASVGGVSPADFGIKIGRDGTFTFDSAKFAEQLAKDPAKVQEVISGVAANVQKVADKASDSVNGSLTSRIQSGEASVKDLATRISSWDDRLASRRQTLVRIYTALEVSMSKMQATSSWLSSQIEQLNSSKA